MTSVELRSLRRGEMESLTRLLWRAFEDDPLFRYLFRSRPPAGHVMRLLFRAQARDALRHGSIEVVTSDQELLAAAVWLSPGSFAPTGPRRILAALPAYLAVGVLFLDRLPDFLRLARSAPSSSLPPFWLLEYLAVDPLWQGRGFGSRLLDSGIERAEEAGLACGLATSNERALRLYQRTGFEVARETRPFEAGPPVWYMWRPPPAGRAD
jgi:ribosomal protein S18 acetylase RimI-like enzyme